MTDRDDDSLKPVIVVDVDIYSLTLYIMHLRKMSVRDDSRTTHTVDYLCFIYPPVISIRPVRKALPSRSGVLLLWIIGHSRQRNERDALMGHEHTIATATHSAPTTPLNFFDYLISCLVSPRFRPFSSLPCLVC